MQTPKPKLSLLGRPTLAQTGERAAPSKRVDLEPVTPERSGFSGTCTNTSLSDWIQLVQMGRRDALLRVRAHGGREGLLWCREGDIIDAACDGLLGADAVYHALSWDGGQVSVEFKRFERPRRIQMATAALLLQSAFRNDSGTQRSGPASDAPVELPIAPVSPAPPSPAPPSPAPPSIAPPSTAALSTAPLSAPPLSTLLLSVGRGLRTAFQPPKRRSRLGVALSLTVGLIFFALFARLVSKATSVSSNATKAASGALSMFPVRIEVEPAQAEIWLDGSPAATGRLEATLPRDGRPHALRLTAAGYATEQVQFRDTPPRERVTLSKLAQPLALGEPPSEVQPVPVASLPSTPGSRAHSAAPWAKANAVGPAKLHAAAPEKSRPALSKPNVQQIEARSPRVQLIDEVEPQIKIIE